jgi:hypothetical protein
MKLRIDKKRIRKSFEKIPRNLGEHAFLTFFILFLISLILGFLIFYNYSILIEKKEITPSKKPVEFKEKDFQKVLEEWRGREKVLEETEQKKYLDPFKGPTKETSKD